MGAVTLTPELRAFASMLGTRLAKFEPSSSPSTEYEEIAEFRLSQRLGVPIGSPEFDRTWEEIIEIAYDMLPDEDDSVFIRDWTPSEAELSGMPMQKWCITVSDRFHRIIRHVIVDARTHGEAFRVVERMNIPGAEGYGYRLGKDIDRIIVMELAETWGADVIRYLAGRLGVDYDSLPIRGHDDTPR